MPIEFVIQNTSLDVVRRTVPTLKAVRERNRKLGLVGQIRKNLAHAKPSNRLEEIIAAELARRSALEKFGGIFGTTAYVIEDRPDAVTLYAAWGGRMGSQRSTLGREGDIGGTFKFRPEGPNLRVVAKTIRETFPGRYRFWILVGFCFCVIPGLVMAAWGWNENRAEAAEIKELFVPVMVEAFRDGGGASGDPITGE